MPVLQLEEVQDLIKTGASTRLPDAAAPRFRVGDSVTVRNDNPVTHTRLPRYVRGKTGVIHEDYGVFSFNDTNAHGLGHKPQHVYSVRFSARALWGAGAPDRDGLYIDLFDDYLSPAAG